MKKRKKTAIVAISFVLIVAVCLTVGLLISKKRAVERYDIRPAPTSPTSYSVQADDSVPLYFGDELESNPDRGYRGEIYITLGSGNSYPPDKTPAIESFKKQIDNFSDDNVNVYQMYVYLIEFWDKPLTEQALAQLTEYLEAVRGENKRVMLRFAYEYTPEMKIGPELKQILSHISQLKQWFLDNKELTDQTVYAMQLGMIGLWGEGHNWVDKSLDKPKNRQQIISAVFDMVPDTMTVMMRQPSYLTLVEDKYKPRASIHDDYLVGVEHPWGMLPFNHPDNQALYNMSQHSISDGEMPWGGDKDVKLTVDPINFLVQVKNYGLRTLSALHNYKENGEDSLKNPFYLLQWKDVMLSEAQFTENKLPYFPLALQQGQISVFDYLDYHLGYLLAATNLKTENNKMSFDIINYGMGAPIDFEMEVKIGDTVQTVALDMSELGQFSSKHFEFDCPDSLEVSVRFKHIRDNNLTIKFANDTAYTDGFNTVRVAKP